MAVPNYQGVTPPAIPLPIVSPPSPADNDGTYIAVWGPKSSGKTMYLTMLRDDIRIWHYKKGWQMDLDKKAGDKIKNDTLAFLEARANSIGQHRYPPNTGTSDPLEYRFRFEKSASPTDPMGHKEFIMHVLDMPGEWFQDPPVEAKEKVYGYLEKCFGILCLIDPDVEDQEVKKYIDKMLDNLSARTITQRIEKWIAFCVTKIDKLQHRSIARDTQKYVLSKIGNAKNAIDSQCNTAKVNYNFHCSAVGYYQTPEGDFMPLRSNSGLNWEGVNIIYNVDHIRPFGLFAPIEWMFEEWSREQAFNRP
jgi:hypothetical protein